MWLWCVLQAFAAEDVRETYDSSGNLVHRMLLVDGNLQEENNLVYANGKLVEKTTVSGPHTKVERWTYAGSMLQQYEVTVDGEVQRRETSTWKDGMLESVRTEVAGEPTQLSRYRYDALGRVVEMERSLESGELLGRVASERSLPTTPIHFALSLGGGWSSQTEVLDLLGGFEISRKPPAELYDQDPLEFKVGAQYKLSRSKGETVNDELSSWFSMDYNHIFPKSTLFLFTTLDRNPVANLYLDLILAPIGYKFAPLESDKAMFDISFAPVWNYRSILAPAGGACDGTPVETDTPCTNSHLRGSFRVRVGYNGASFNLSDAINYLPAVDTENVGNGFGDGAIFTNTFGLGLKLSSALTLSENFVFTRDLSLADQVDCAADPDNLLCSGIMYTSATTLGVAFDLRR